MLQDPISVQETNATDSAQSTSLMLPDAPYSESGAVKAWSEPVEMLSYMPAEPDRNPLFLEKRVYQGSSGRVYPLPVIDSVATVPQVRSWQAVHIENEFIRLMVMPEIGGRIHVGLDKRTGYDFFYRQNVIKPALVGLAGPWISGGVEFNWPQHHRPATFMAVEVSIERSLDGSVTVWCSDHDPMARMKGMHGICLHPGKAYVEVKVRLYNRTLDTQTFLWWANVATRVHERYQSFFPHDVGFAADHAKRAVTEYPLSRGTYYGVDYGERARTGVPTQEVTSHFVPDGSYAANDLGWYANIPVPTSYMIVGSRGDFFGGYDHAAQAGTVAVANHHISPGKKQWTWGNHEFGYAWDRSLTDNDGPYVELMSGVYADNQPDFSFLAPGETKTFSQFWYPVGAIGTPDIANIEGALRLESTADQVTAHLQVTSDRLDCTITMLQDGVEIARWREDLSVKEVYQFTASEVAFTNAIEVTVSQAGHVLLRYAPAEIVPVERPEVATEPALPEDVASSDELYLNGLHLEQYRHPTRDAQTYWLEAVRRDPGDSRSNHALGRFHMRRGEFDVAEKYLRTAIARLTKRNPNPSDGEPHYNLGLVLQFQGRDADAYDAFYKSTWNAAWRGPAYQRLAEIDCSRKEWAKALHHLGLSLVGEAENLNALNLKAVTLSKLGPREEAASLLSRIRAIDPLDSTSRYLADGNVITDAQQQLDLVFDFMRAGLLEESLTVLLSSHDNKPDGGGTLKLYATAQVLHRMGRDAEAKLAWQRAAAGDPSYVFPSRLEEMVMLELVIRENLVDARAHYYLGNLLYDRRRHHEAISHWERSAELDPLFPTTWRNLGFARFNVLHDAKGAAAAFARAADLSPLDARIAYEHDQLMKRINLPLKERLAGLRNRLSLVEQRDDLSVELASLLNSTGQPEEALKLLLSRRFGPWEGGEGQVLMQYVRANILFANKALLSGQTAAASNLLERAGEPPQNLSEAKHLLMNLSMIDTWKGTAFAQHGDLANAHRYWERAANQRGDFQQMQVQAVSDTTYWSALALRALGREAEATALFQAIETYASLLEEKTPQIDYFATSLPAMLLFDEDIKERQKITALFLRAQAQLGLKHQAEAVYLLQQTLLLDCSHTGAIDLLALIAKQGN
jgi:tetratricopeptide (TPR) repeat protein